ncbi:hypothetical protein ACIA6C_14625 [Streptomyces sp. NPDC051578]
MSIALAGHVKREVVDRERVRRAVSLGVLDLCNEADDGAHLLL